MGWKHVALATAVAGLFGTGAAGSALAADESHEGKVKCEGVNACRGQGACNTAHNACAGQNGCAGQGHVWLTPEACEKAKAEAAAKKR